MRILILCRSFNSLTQRVYVELEAQARELSVEYDINDRVAVEAVELFRPDLVLATYLTRRIPEAIWRRVPTLVVHPGPVGDGGPSALDHAIMDDVPTWGVTLLQADADFDAGPVWASRPFAMRAATKSSLYRGEVTDAAVACVLEAVEAFARGTHRPIPTDEHPERAGRWRDALRQTERAIDWYGDATDTVMRKLRAADSQPGVRCALLDREVHLFDAHEERHLEGVPGSVVARRHEALCVATVDGAVWIGQLRGAASDGGDPTFKLPATTLLADRLVEVPEVPIAVAGDAGGTWRDISYREDGAIGWLSFDFAGGGMSTAQCRRLLWAYAQARRRPTQVLVLLGGREFFSNGMNLNTIEAAASPAEESWRNINALDDLAEAMVETTDKLIVAAIRGNAGAGGVFLALAADYVLAREGVVLNPHYKNMGNLYGSELWTYLLPRRLNAEAGAALMARRRPVGVAEAASEGMIDLVLPVDRATARSALATYAADLAADGALAALLDAKARRRAADEATKPLAAYREAELLAMRKSFFGFDPSYHVARYHFVAKTPASRTPLHLARHRAAGPLASTRA